ncbi:DUF3805 domain-containing protein [Epilithonimonas sp.]|uniref:DUF3805 domain-containing protein n=1 Tax=Epilithonimonas sp. TaxID=2894511 RepID=UPI002FDD0CE2
MKNLFSLFILLIFISCNFYKDYKVFNSEYDYSINLPKSWAEYETDEKNTNAFFDRTKWSGNLRISPINIKINNLRDVMIQRKVENIDWGNIRGIYYIENIKNEEIHYWYLKVNNKLYICSFTIGNIKGRKEIKNELAKVETILKSIKSN